MLPALWAVLCATWRCSTISGEGAPRGLQCDPLGRPVDEGSALLVTTRECLVLAGRREIHHSGLGSWSVGFVNEVSTENWSWCSWCIGSTVNRAVSSGLVAVFQIKMKTLIDTETETTTEREGQPRHGNTETETETETDSLLKHCWRGSSFLQTPDCLFFTSSVRQAIF